MARLLFLVEGETEETFVNEFLASHLYAVGLESVSARLLGNARLRSRRGGIRAWPEVERDILRHLRQDRAVAVTTMVDYYGLPHKQGDQRAWPGRATASALPFPQRASHVEAALSSRLEEMHGKELDTSRFIPYVVMHEFEGLLFSDCSKFADAIGKPNAVASFQAIRDQFSTPEEINDSPTSHPSQRVLDLVPEYQKPFYGTIAALEIGLTTIRCECPNFDSWLTRLEALA